MCGCEERGGEVGRGGGGGGGGEVCGCEEKVTIY